MTFPSKSPSEGATHPTTPRAREDRLLDVSEVAELLRVPERWVRDHTRQGLIPHVRLGRYVRYDRADVLAWVEASKTGGQGADWRRIRPRQYLAAVPTSPEAA